MTIIRLPMNFQTGVFSTRLPTALRNDITPQQFASIIESCNRFGKRFKNATKRAVHVLYLSSTLVLVITASTFVYLGFSKIVIWFLLFLWTISALLLWRFIVRSHRQQKKIVEEMKTYLEDQNEIIFIKKGIVLKVIYEEAAYLDDPFIEILRIGEQQKNTPKTKTNSLIDLMRTVTSSFISKRKQKFEELPIDKQKIAEINAKSKRYGLVLDQKISPRPSLWKKQIHNTKRKISGVYQYVRSSIAKQSAKEVIGAINCDPSQAVQKIKKMFTDKKVADDLCSKIMSQDKDVAARELNTLLKCLYYPRTLYKELPQEERELLYKYIIFPKLCYEKLLFVKMMKSVKWEETSQYNVAIEILNQVTLY